MKNLFCLVFTLVVPLVISAQKKVRNVTQELIWMTNALEKKHIEPRKIDDDLSADLFQKFLDELDPERIIFLAPEVVTLAQFRNQLDEEINGRSTRFLVRLKTAYKKGLERSEKLINATFTSSLDWNKNEMYAPDTSWLSDEVALADRHRQWLKYQVLDRLVELVERDPASAQFFETHVEGATHHVWQAALRPLKRLLSDPMVFDNEVSDVFLHSLAGVFDVHSDYFSLEEYDDFVGALSTQDYYFGFMLGEDGKGNVVITALAPGGPAWKSGVLHVSDALVRLGTEGGDAIDLAGMNIDDVNEVLSENQDDVLEMTVRGMDGTLKPVTLRKEKMVNEENVVQSFILEGNVRAGYIYLPDFYTRWEDDQEGGRCANDVAKEIIKLKKDGIEGLILDLRFNGGGSLYEAAAMAGIFIDEGPLSMVRTREKKAISLKDMNRGTVYDGPLLLMVNGASASASEVLAATIQDYNRGIIVGSRTYGKATGQSLFPIEGIESAETKKDGSGYIKITTQRLYRLTGKSSQGKGVHPDVEIPDVFDALDLSESQYQFALKADSVSRNAYFKPMVPVDKKELQRRSAERIAGNTTFQELLRSISSLEAEIEKQSGPQPLDWKTFLTGIRERENKESEVEAFKSSETVYNVSNGSAKVQQLTVDDYAREINARWLLTLSTDIQVQETYQILNDYISLTKNP